MHQDERSVLVQSSSRLSPELCAPRNTLKENK